MTTIAEPKQTYAGSIRLEGQPDVKRARLMLSGGKATILSYDPPDKGDIEAHQLAEKRKEKGQRTKPEQVDVMKDVSLDLDGDRLTIKGRSLFARRRMKLADDTVTYVMDLSKGCQGCGA